MYKSILKAYSTSEIIQICKYLNKDYNIYEPDDVRWRKIKYALSKTPENELFELRKSTFSNEFVNYLIMKYYICERVVKYHFIKHLQNAIHDIVAFEMSIGDSRIDICRINGKLCAYEIKTEYDNYDRLYTQMLDYFKAFEKIYIIIPDKKLTTIKEHVPEECGIITYRIDTNNNMLFSYRRAAKENDCDIKFCIQSLSNCDLIKLLKMLKEKPYKVKNDNLNLLLNIIKEKNIWPTYKLFLKNKYENQWKYLKDNFENILPIDCQSFFASRMNPDILYEKRNGHMAL